MKLCIECRRFNTDPLSPTSCTAQGNYVPDFVTGGKPRAIYSSAQGVRLDPSMCGPDGKWHEPKVKEAEAA